MFLAETLERLLQQNQPIRHTGRLSRLQCRNRVVVSERGGGVGCSRPSAFQRMASAGRAARPSRNRRWRDTSRRDYRPWGWVMRSAARPMPPRSNASARSPLAPALPTHISDPCFATSRRSSHPNHYGKTCKQNIAIGSYGRRARSAARRLGASDRACRWPHQLVPLSVLPRSSPVPRCNAEFAG